MQDVSYEAVFIKGKSDENIHMLLHYPTINNNLQWCWQVIIRFLWILQGAEKTFFFIFCTQEMDLFAHEVDPLKQDIILRYNDAHDP